MSTKEGRGSKRRGRKKKGNGGGGREEQEKNSCPNTSRKKSCTLKCRKLWNWVEFSSWFFPNNLTKSLNFLTSKNAYVFQYHWGLMILYQVDDNLESSLLRNSELDVPKEWCWFWLQQDMGRYHFLSFIWAIIL